RVRVAGVLRPRLAIAAEVLAVAVKDPDLPALEPSRVPGLRHPARATTLAPLHLEVLPDAPYDASLGADELGVLGADVADDGFLRVLLDGGEPGRGQGRLGWRNGEGG